MMNKTSFLLLLSLSLSTACGTGTDDPELVTSEDNLLGTVTCNNVFALMESVPLIQMSASYTNRSHAVGATGFVALNGSIAETSAAAVVSGVFRMDRAFVRLRKSTYRFGTRTYPGTAVLTLSLTNGSRPVYEFETTVESCEVTDGVATVIAQGPSSAHVVLKISEAFLDG